jgi:hypothetical protein
MPLVISFGALSAFAEEGEAKEEPKKEEGKKEESKSSLQSEWFELQSRLLMLKARVQAKKNEVNALIKEKEEVRDDQKAVEVVNQLKRQHKELRAVSQEYEEVRAQLNYRFPEKGLTEARKYERIEIKSIDDMEKELSLESKVKNTLVLVRKQYPGNAPSQAREIASEPPAPAPENKKHADPSRVLITEPQILNK